LSLKIVLVLNIKCVYRALFLDLPSRLDGIVLEVTVFTFERFEDDVSEKRHSEEQESSDPLRKMLVRSVAMRFIVNRETYVVMAVHAQTLDLHNTGLFIPLDEISRFLELRLHNLLLRCGLVVRGHFARL
jgi:hypothetical protein